MRISDWSSDVCSSDLLVDECGLTIAPSAPMAPGHIDRWMVYDAETFRGVVGGSVSESAVRWATPLGRTKRVVAVISTLLSGDRDRGAVGNYDRMADLASWAPSGRATRTGFTDTGV